jgi:hypothetical protein
VTYFGTRPYYTVPCRRALFLQTISTESRLHAQLSIRVNIKKNQPDSAIVFTKGNQAFKRPCYWPGRAFRLAAGGFMNTVEILLAALRALAEAMISLRGHVRFNREQNRALEHACELIVRFESGEQLQ